eukprot:scaffold20223_cov64-Attheya_sp.AAC.2
MWRYHHRDPDAVDKSYQAVEVTNEKVTKNPDVVWVIGMSEKVIETQLKLADIEKVIGRNEKVKNNPDFEFLRKGDSKVWVISGA